MIPIRGELHPVSDNPNKGIISSQITIEELINSYVIDHDINRDINYGRLPDVVKYLESSTMEPGIFLPAFVFSHRGNSEVKYDAEGGVIWIEDRFLVTIDGQHRIKAIEKYLQKHPEDSQFKRNTVTVQVYFGLSGDDERQLFVDINSNAKRVSRSLVIQYDSREISNLLIKELYKSCKALQAVGLELEKSKVQRPGNTSFATGLRLRTFLYYLLYRKKSISKSDEELLHRYYEDVVSFVVRLFDELLGAFPEEPGDVRQYVLGHEPVQNAIAMHLHDSFISFDQNGLQVTGVWEDAVEELAELDWSVNNVIWRRMGTTKTTNQGQYLGFNESDREHLYTHIRGMVGS